MTSFDNRHGSEISPNNYALQELSKSCVNFIFNPVIGEDAADPPVEKGKGGRGREPKGKKAREPKSRAGSLDQDVSKVESTLEGSGAGDNEAAARKSRQESGSDKENVATLAGGDAGTKTVEIDTGQEVKADTEVKVTEVKVVEKGRNVDGKAPPTPGTPLLDEKPSWPSMGGQGAGQVQILSVEVKVKSDQPKVSALAAPVGNGSAPSKTSAPKVAAASPKVTAKLPAAPVQTPPSDPAAWIAETAYVRPRNESGELKRVARLPSGENSPKTPLHPTQVNKPVKVKEHGDPQKNIVKTPSKDVKHRDGSKEKKSSSSDKSKHRHDKDRDKSKSHSHKHKHSSKERSEHKDGKERKPKSSHEEPSVKKVKVEGEGGVVVKTEVLDSPPSGEHSYTKDPKMEDVRVKSLKEEDGKHRSHSGSKEGSPAKVKVSSSNSSASHKSSKEGQKSDLKTSSHKSSSDGKVPHHKSSSDKTPHKSSTSSSSSSKTPHKSSSDSSHKHSSSSSSSRHPCTKEGCTKPHHNHHSKHHHTPSKHSSSSSSKHSSSHNSSSSHTPSKKRHHEDSSHSHSSSKKIKSEHHSDPSSPRSEKSSSSSHHKYAKVNGFSDVDLNKLKRCSHSHADYLIKKQSRRLPGLKYGHLMHIEEDANGNALVLHAYQEDLDQLNPQQMKEFVDEYLQLSFKEETEGACLFVMSIIHGAAAYIPDCIDHFADNYPTMVVKQGVLGKSDIETTTFSEFRENVAKSYSEGTFRHGPLLQVSINLEFSF